MKLRNGFVSNSSSSSFIVTNKGYTTSYVARIMVRHVAESRAVQRNEPGDCNQKYFERLDADLAKYEKLVEENFDGNIEIPWTCNYETHIERGHFGINVRTCNNERWFDIEDFDMEYLDDEDSMEH